MPSAVLSRLGRTFRGGFVRTTKERWIDGIAFLATLLYQFLVAKPSTFWEAAEPFVWLLGAICAVHIIRATVEVWRGISREPTVREVESPILLPDAGKRKTLIEEPHPPFFRTKLLGMLLTSLTLLSLSFYLVRRAAATSTRTFIYLVPSAELVECNKRAFFVETVGPRILHNVVIVLKDNKSGQTYTETYPEIDPSPRSMDVYFWFAPSSRWDEDYTVTVKNRESHSSQQIILRSVQHQTQFAMQITVDENRKPTVACRDALLPESYTLAAGEHRTCAEFIELADDVPTKLDVYSYQRADGNFAIRRVRTLPSPSELDEQSDDRHITEYQRQIIEPILDKYKGSLLRIYFAGGQKTETYAQEFQKLFSGKNWMTEGPTLVPIGNELIVDVQLSVNYQENWNKNNPKPHAIMDALERAGIKKRRRLNLDPNVPSDWIVLWVGPRSPKDLKPDQCSPAETKPAVGQHHTCEMIAQIDGECPFPPP